MNSRNRRMFKPKNAGKQAAGILASSPQLMQSVQRRANGGVQSGGSKVGGMTLEDLAELRQKGLQAGPFGLSKQNIEKFGQNAPDDTRIGRFGKAVIRAGNKPMFSDSTLSVIPSPVDIASSIGSGIKGIYNYLTAQPYDPGSASQYRPGTVPSADNTRPGPSLSAVSGLGQILGQESVPIAEGAEQLGMLPSEEIIDSSVTVDTEAPTTKQETQTQTQTQTQVDETISVNKGTQEINPVKGTPTKAMEVADGLLIKRDNQKDQDKKAASTASAPEIIQQSVNEALQTQNNPDVSPKEKAETTDELLGIVQTTEEPTRKERIEARKAMLTDLLGEDAAKDIRTDANYNLMMTGLLIAAGESPNALANIAKGAAAGLSKYGDVVGDKAVKKREREEKISLQAISDIRDEMATEDQREYDSLVRSAQQDHEVKLQDNKYINDLKLLDRKLNDAEQRQIREHDLKIQLANQSVLQSFALFDLQDEQKTRLLESEMSFKKELQQLQNNADSADMKMVKAIQLADKSLSFPDAYAKFKAQTGKNPTDEQQRYSRLLPMLGHEKAVIYAMSGVVEEIFEQKGFEKGLAEVTGTNVAGSSQQPTFDGTSQSTGVPTISTQSEFDALPSGAEYIDPGDGLKYRKP